MKFNEVLSAMGSADLNVAGDALHQYAQGLQLPLRKGIMDCNNLLGIYEEMDVSNIQCLQLPVDMLQPGTEGQYSAYVVPNCGYIPQNTVQGDYITVPTYFIANSIDWCVKYARDANYMVQDRATKIFRDGFVAKMNADGWHTILAAGLDRNIVVYDNAAPAGYLTKRLISLAQLVMSRNGGGNAQCPTRPRLTDVVMSPEAMEDIRNWNVDQIDEITRREIHVGGDGERVLARLFGVNLHVLHELGQNAPYQLYYNNVLGGTLPAGDVELLVGLDLSESDSFVMPVKQQLVVYDDPTLLRQMKVGVFGWMELGFLVADGRRVLLMSIQFEPTLKKE